MDAKTRNHWWLEALDTNKAQALFETLKTLETQQNYRATDLLRFARLYGGREFQGFGLSQYSKDSHPTPYKGSVSLNVVRSCADTVVAMTAKNRPRPTFLTDGGDFGQREKAKLLNKFTRGMFYENHTHEVSAVCARDAAVFGTGVKKHFLQNGRVKSERVFCGQLFVDDAESIWADPRQLYQVMPIARDVLRGMFLDAEEPSEKKAKEARNELRVAIDKAEEEDTGGQTFLGDMVRVIEGWHLPSSDGADDGMHIIATSAGALVVEPWTRPYFPFSFLCWSKPIVGFWGSGVAEQLIGKQLEINKLAKRIQQMMHHSVNRLLLPSGSKVPKNLITNDPTSVIEYEGMAPPSVWQGSMVPAEYFQRLPELRQEAFDEIGVSQMSASGRKPAGLNSGAAIREYNDTGDARFALFGQAYEQFHLDEARIAINLVRDYVDAMKAAPPEDAKPDYEVVMPDKKQVERIKWSQIDLEEEQYVMQMFPVSSLPSNPAARQETVAEWVAQGWVTSEEGRRLLDFPDLEASTNLAVAQLDDIDRTIDDMLEKGKAQMPEPFQALQLGLKRMGLAYLRARAEGYPEDRLELLRSWMAGAKDMMAANAPPPQAPPALPPGAAPPGPDAGAPPPPGLPQAA